METVLIIIGAVVAIYLLIRFGFSLVLWWSKRPSKKKDKR